MKVAKAPLIIAWFSTAALLFGASNAGVPVAPVAIAPQGPLDHIGVVRDDGGICRGEVDLGSGRAAFDCRLGFALGSDSVARFSSKSSAVPVAVDVDDPTGHVRFRVQLDPVADVRALLFEGLELVFTSATMPSGELQIKLRLETIFAADFESGTTCGTWSVTVTPEICDGVDNDCDDIIDEGIPEVGTSCNTGDLGVCANGLTMCVNGELTCFPIAAPSPEVCDGLDNDCDGVTDDGNPGGGASCNTGLPGVCASGLTSCENGMLSCLQTNQPSTEVCDGLDNDCDGATDEGNPGGGAACSTGLLGVCAPGTTSCIGGALVCNQNTQPSPEVCDGLDNDCDGTTDEGDLCPEGAPCVGGMCS